MAVYDAGVTTGTSTLQHLASVYYDRKALSSLRATLQFSKLADERTLALRNGKTIQFFRYSELGANTSATSEGTSGSSQSLTTSTVSATVAQYSDYMTLSDLLVDTAIDDITAAAVERMSYRAALSVDTIIRNEIDSAASSIDVSPIGTYFSAADLAQIRAIFAGNNIPPLRAGKYVALAHPFVLYDFWNDPAAGGFQDIVKQLKDQADKLVSPEDRGYAGQYQSVQLWESTNVTTVSGTPNKYRVYFAGEEGLAVVPLQGRGPKLPSGKDYTFNLNVVRRPPIGPANPEGKLGAIISYNFVFAAKILDTTNYRLRKIDVPTSLGL